MDELKKYLQKHTDELNLDEPRVQVWQNIQQETGNSKKRVTILMFTRWAVAASVLVLAGIGTWYVLSDKKTNPVQLTAKIEKKTAVPVPVQNEPLATQKIISSVITKAKTTVKINKSINPPQPLNSNAELLTLSNIENSFTQVINLQRARVSSMPMYAETPEYFIDFKIQIRQMAKDEKVIKSDIAKRGMNDALLDQLINLYQQKLTILKQLQIEMNKTNNRFKQNRGPVDSTRTYFLNI